MGLGAEEAATELLEEAAMELRWSGALPNSSPDRGLLELEPAEKEKRGGCGGTSEDEETPFC